MFVVDVGVPPELATSGIVLQVHELRHPALSVAAQGLISIDKKGPMIQYKKDIISSYEIYNPTVVILCHYVSFSYM